MQIEHDPNESPQFRMRVLRWTIMAQVFVLVGVLVVWRTYSSLGEYDTYDWRNVPFTIAFLLLLGWCFLPRHVENVGEDTPGQKLAFRLGKFLNGVLRRFR